MCPCRLIQCRIALRRNTANPTPCTSLGKRTGGGFNPFGVEVSHGLAMAGSVMRSPKLRCFLDTTAGHQTVLPRRAPGRSLDNIRSRRLVRTGRLGRCLELPRRCAPKGFA